MLRFRLESFHQHTEFKFQIGKKNNKKSYSFQITEA